MENAKVGNVWEVYSPSEGWVRVVVAKVDNDQVILRYEGTLELLTVDARDLYANPDRFRVVFDDEG